MRGSDESGGRCTLIGQIDIWTIYLIAFAFGVADAFMFPAASAFPPRLLPPERLISGNSLLQGTAQLTLVVGPLIAGALIALLGSVSGPNSKTLPDYRWYLRSTRSHSRHRL